MAEYRDLKTTTNYGLTVSREDKINYYRAMENKNLEKYKGVKALSIRQPWASLIVDGYKDIENRTWNTNYRGYILIHAAKTFEDNAVGAINSILWDQSTDEDKDFINGVSEIPGDYKRGGFIGIARLNDVVIMDDSPWFFGPKGFKIRMPQPIDFIPFPGQLKLFDVPDTIIKQIKIKK